MTDLSDPKPATSPRASLWMRLLWMVVVAILMGAAQWVLNLLGLVQLVIMATSKGAPNAELAGFGKRLGVWMAKAARYQAADSEERPWPWSRLD